MFQLILIFFFSFYRFSLSAECNVLYQLDDMSFCRIGQPFDVYRNYGCSCSGFSPNKPIDQIDKCCFLHNQCYINLTSAKVCQNQNAPFYCFYKWQCLKKTCQCDNNSKCLQSVCQCDQEFIDCLAKYPYPEFQKKCPFTFIRTTPHK